MKITHTKITVKATVKVKATVTRKKPNINMNIVTMINKKRAMHLLQALIP